MKKVLKQIHYKQNRLQQLRGFCHVVQTGSISKAAERMYLSQPSVSLQIQALERELKVTLFERNGPSLKLTPEGETLYELARPLVDGMDNLYETFVETYALSDAGTIKIAVNPSIMHYIINHPLKSFIREFANVKVEVELMKWEEAVDALKNDEIDVAITGLPEEKPYICYEPFFSADTVLITPKAHPLAALENPSLADISAYPLVVAKGFSMLSYVFKQHNLDYSIKAEVSSLELVKHFVASGLGVAILSSACVGVSDMIEVKDLSMYFPYREYGVLLREGRFHSPQVKNFLKILRASGIYKKQSEKQIEKKHTLTDMPVAEVV